MRSGAGETFDGRVCKGTTLEMNLDVCRFRAGCQSSLFEGGEIAIGAETMSWEEGRIQWAIGTMYQRPLSWGRGAC
jgi:hypothetical protein